MQDEVSGEEESTLESNDLPGDQAEVNEAEKLNEEIVAELLADDELSGTEELEEQVSQAMSMVPNPDLEPNTVMDVFQKGYTLNGRLVRPAMVVVSKAG